MRTPVIPRQALPELLRMTNGPIQLNLVEVLVSAPVIGGACGWNGVPCAFPMLFR
jgi:hypothetical protein